MMLRDVSCVGKNKYVLPSTMVHLPLAGRVRSRRPVIVDTGWIK